MRAESLSIADIQADLDESPFVRTLGIVACEWDVTSSTLLLRMPMSSSVERWSGSGQVHGGAIASLIDTAACFAAACALRQGVPTINLHADYLRPAGGAALMARAITRRLGRTVGVVDVEVTGENGDLVAIGRACLGTAKPPARTETP